MSNSMSDAAAWYSDGPMSGPTTDPASGETTGGQMQATTYGELVGLVDELRLQTYEYRDAYRPFPTAPEETPPAGFVTTDNVRLGSGIDFNVFLGQLVQNNNGLPNIFKIKPAPREAFGDHEFRAGGTSGGGGSYMRMEQEPEVTLVALKECVKSIHKSGGRGAVLSTFLKEIQVLGKLKHCSDVVHLFGVAFTSIPHSEEVKPTLILELAVEHLVHFLKSPPSNITTIDWAMKSLFAKDVCNGLKAVHQLGITHADVKGQNILVIWDEARNGYRAKLSDFGHSRPTTSTVVEVGGTLRYLAPECWLGSHSVAKQNDVNRDVYALGLLIWGIATGFERPPFYDFDDEKLQGVVIEMAEETSGTAAKYHALPDNTPPSFRQVLKETLWSDPQKRASVSTVASLLKADVGGSNPAMDPEEPQADASPPLIRNLTKKDRTDADDSQGNALDENPLLKVPLSLQEHLLREFRESSNSTLSDSATASQKSLGYLAYCYVLMADSNGGVREERERALPFLRAAALRDPFQPIGNSKLTPFRMLMELHDWHGLAELFQLNDVSYPEFVQSCLGHVYSFGWQKLLVYVCMAGFAASTDVDALRKASQIVAINILKLLVSLEACPPRPGAASFNRVTALHASILTGKIDAAKELLVTGADVDAEEPSQYRTALHLCCQSKDFSDELSTEIARAISDKNPEAVNAVAGPAFKYTPLRFALEAGKHSLLSLLVERGADANARAENGSTVLQQCVSMGDSFVPFARILLESKTIDINALTGHGPWTALGIAMNGSNRRLMVELLLDHGADHNISCWGEPLIHKAVHTNQNTKDECPFLGLLLRAGASSRQLMDDPKPNRRKESQPALFPLSLVHCAASHSALLALRQLLEHDPGLYEWAHPILPSRPLHIAIMCSGASADEDVYAMVDFLVGLVNQIPTFSVDEANEDGNTPLHLASMYGMEFIIPCLITGGCSTSATNSKGQDPLSLYTEWLKMSEIEPSEKRDTLRALYHGHHSWDIPSNVLEALSLATLSTPTQGLSKPRPANVEDGPKDAIPSSHNEQHKHEQEAIPPTELDEGSSRASTDRIEPATAENTESLPEIPVQNLVPQTSAFHSYTAWLVQLFRGATYYLETAFYHLFRQR